MIRPGVCLCPVCGCASNRPFYASDVSTEAAWLKKSGTQGYYLEDFENRRKHYHLTDPDGPDFQDGWPDKVEFYKDDSSGERLTMHRCCPECFNGRVDNTSRKTRFRHFVGRVPLYVVAVIGSRSAGKTAWLGALSSGALGPLNRQDYAYQLYLDQPGDETAVSKRTVESGDAGSSNYIEIWDAKRGELAAMVLMLDTAGENYKKFVPDDIFTDNGQVDSPVRRLVYGDGGLNPGIDGAVLIDPAVHGHAEDGTMRIWQGVRNKLRGIPVAYVYTCADELIQAQSSRPDKSKPPLLTWDTFPNTTYTGENFHLLTSHFHPDRIRSRLVIQEEIAQTIQMPGYRYIADNCAERHGFVVRSCRPIPAKDGKESRNDYTHQFNVADPLLWMLDRLRLFPLRLERGGRH